VGYNRDGSFAVQERKEEELLFVEHNVIKVVNDPEIVGVYYNRENFSVVPTTEETLFHCGQNRGKPPPLCPTMQEMLLHCISHRQKIKSLQ
jgi:hypothetical protein